MPIPQDCAVDLDEISRRAVRAEALESRGSPSLSHSASEVVIAQQIQHPGRHGARIPDRDQEARLAVPYDLGDTAVRGSDHRHPLGHGLDQDPAERLALRRVDQNVEGPEDPIDVFLMAGEHDALSQPPLGHLPAEPEKIVLVLRSELRRADDDEASG